MQLLFHSFSQKNEEERDIYIYIYFVDVTLCNIYIYYYFFKIIYQVKDVYIDTLFLRRWVLLPQLLLQFFILERQRVGNKEMVLALII